MESIKISKVIEANRYGIKDTVQRSLCALEKAQCSYPSLIMDVVRTGNLSRQIDLAQSETQGNGRIENSSPLSDASGAYFANEEIFGGSRENEVNRYIKELGEESVPEWKSDGSKLKLGPGVGFIEPPSVYRRLINKALNNPKLVLNYTAPNGSAETKKGIKAIMDSRIDPEGSFYPEKGVFLTDGATEGIDLFMEAISKMAPSSRVVILGLSYYTGAYSATQKGLKPERLVASPFKTGSETRFFPDAAEIERSVPKDASSLVLTAPNNPNGEVYDDRELTKIITLAKKRNLYILFDSIFENLNFDEPENYRSRVLRIASELGALDRVVVVDSLSKNKNLAGERIGFLATADDKMASALEDIVLSRRCNPRLTLGPLVSFEGMARKAKVLTLNSPGTPIEKIADYVQMDAKYPFGRDEFIKMYREWDQWDREALRYYQDNLRIVKALLQGTATAGSPDSAGYNTFVKVQEPGPGVNSMDFLAKLMFTMGTYTQVGPCFGLSQRTWDGSLGIWPRITYASSRGDLIEAVTRLVIFSQFYQERSFGDPNRFPTLKIRFDNQI